MQKKIVKTLVNDEDRINFLPLKLPKYYLVFEQYVYAFMDKFCEEYNGGYWKYYTLTNNGFYIRLDSDQTFNVSNSNNFFDDKMSTDAACIGVNLYALNYLANISECDEIIRFYYSLRNYAQEHEDILKIFRFID